MMRFCLAVTLAIAIGSVLAAQQPQQTAPTIGPAVITDLTALAKKNHSSTFLGLSKRVGDSLAFTVVSNRSLIAFMSASTAEEGGRYTPPAAVRSDIVVVTCGDADLGEIFECSRVTVTAANGRRVNPIATDSGVRSYRNALGAGWKAHRTVAHFRIEPLRGGFTVTAHSPDGTEWPLEVSAEEASMALLIGTALPSVQRESPSGPSPSGPPPSQLVVTITSNGEGWRIANQHSSYTWRNCTADVGASSARLPALEPNGAIIVNRTDFRPTLQPGGAQPSVTCKAGNQSYMATSASPTGR
jgi:hypothetical protein